MQRATIAAIIVLSIAQGVFADVGYSDSSELPLDLVGVRRAWADSAEFTITTESLFTVDFIVVEKRRVGRTIFDYDCKIVLKNNSLLGVRVMQCGLQSVPAGMSVIDANASGFGDIGAGESVTSTDTCTLRVDRSQNIIAAQVKWQVTYEIIRTGQTMQLSSMSELKLEPKAAGDITGDDTVDSSDLMLLAGQWLSAPDDPSADIAPDGGDGVVNFADFAALAGHWLEGK
jgi:hypothetical protein